MAAQGDERPLPTTAACHAILSAITTLPLPLAADSSWYLVTACPGGGAAFATTVGLVASSEDTVTLKTVLALAHRFKDGNAFEAFRTLALNSSATMKARAMAFYGLILADYPPTYLKQPIHTVLPAASEPCPSTQPLGGVWATGKPLPGDYRERIASAARTVTKTTSAPAGVRAAARCALSFVKWAVPPDVVPASLGLTYICGDTFEIQNPNPDPAIVEYTVNEKPARVTLNVAANGSRRFVTRTTGTVHLYYRGALVKGKQNGGTACPSTPPPA